MELSQSNQEIIVEHATREYPKECCGLLVSTSKKVTAIPCINRSETPEKNFVIRADDIKDFPLSKIKGFYHSHKDYPDFTIADVAFSEKLNKDSFIYICDSKQFKHYIPHGAKIPYVGRQFFPGVLDCLTLVQDYFHYELNIKLPNLTHDYRDMTSVWQTADIIESQKKDSTLIQFLRQNSFTEVKDLKKFDVIVLSLKTIPYPIHTAIYLGENKVLHHLKEFSEIEPYREVYKRFTFGIFRHKELL